MADLQPVTGDQALSLLGKELLFLASSCTFSITSLWLTLHPNAQDHHGPDEVRSCG